jgi:hypothetical protein
MHSMKNLFLLLFLLIPTLTWAQSSKLHTHPISKVLKRARCYLTVTKRPITIYRDEYAGYSNQLMLATHTTSRRDRVIPINRVMRISGEMNDYQLKITDTIITTACVSMNGKDCANLNEISFRDLERMSGHNVRISCLNSIF